MSNNSGKTSFAFRRVSKDIRKIAKRKRAHVIRLP